MGHIHTPLPCPPKSGIPLDHPNLQRPPMDYSKSGNPKGARSTLRGPDHAQKGAPKSVSPPRETKEQLLARMKAAAAAKKDAKS